MSVSSPVYLENLTYPPNRPDIREVPKRMHGVGRVRYRGFVAKCLGKLSGSSFVRGARGCSLPARVVRPASEGTAPSQGGQPVGFLVRSIGGLTASAENAPATILGTLASMWFWRTGQSTNTLPNMC